MSKILILLALTARMTIQDCFGVNQITYHRKTSNTKCFATYIHRVCKEKYFVKYAWQKKKTVPLWSISSMEIKTLSAPCLSIK